MFAHTEELPLRGWSARPSWRPTSLSSAVVAVLLAVSALSAARTWNLVDRARAESPAPAARPGLVTSFGNRASHNRRYHAEVVSTSKPVVGTQQRWTVRLARHDHRRLAGARVSAELWMPESGERSPVRPTVSSLGGGRYAVDGVYLSRAGWWNLALVIDGSAGTDSVAFNTVVPQ